MPKRSENYPQEYIDYITKLVLDENLKCTDVARDQGISVKNIYRWKTAEQKRRSEADQAQDYKTPSEYQEREKELLKTYTRTRRGKSDSKKRPRTSFRTTKCSLPVHL
ncbi:transposase [Piscibacillus salipiscarius]|uniref:transposase n=1 Tax=Piscibacillus salipiscarius TaxID=299480 RepID=UPI0006D086CE|nr:transposase [Piscibacillus salipiscarius]